VIAGILPITELAKSQDVRAAKDEAATSKLTVSKARNAFPAGTFGQGTILWQGEDLTRARPAERNFGLLFQDGALFPHLNVAQNVGFGLKTGRRKERRTVDESAERLRELLELVNLTGYEERDVATLSGGERQRVALARTLAPTPRLVMLDEPLASLEEELRRELASGIRQILQATGTPALLVSHSAEEAEIMADRLVHPQFLPQAGADN
jgi:thiamine transport system ATP-binding protein